MSAISQVPSAVWLSGVLESGGKPEGAYGDLLAVAEAERPPFCAGWNSKCSGEQNPGGVRGPPGVDSLQILPLLDLSLNFCLEKQSPDG